MCRLRNKRLCCLLGLFLIGSLCHAQEDEPTISADRPGALTGPDVMPLHKLQWETGIAYESLVGDYRTFTLNNTLFRFGLFENTELRIGTDFLFNENMDPKFGIAPLCIGLKTKLNEGERLLPSVALLAQLNSPHIGTKALLPERLSPSLHLLFEHTLSDKFVLGYNIGAEWDDQAAAPATFLGLGLYYDMTEHFGTFLETYNYLHPGEENQYLTEFGFTWLVSRRVQLDLAADLDLLNLNSYHLISFGISWLIN